MQKNDTRYENVIDKLLEAAKLAPTGCNFQPWRILILNTDTSLEFLKSCTKCHFDAPTAMLVCYHRKECWTRKYDGAQSGIIDASIVATHIILEAADIGVGATWVMHFDPAAIRSAFHIPDDVETVALLVMGYPAPDATPMNLHEEYRNLNDIVYYDRFS